MDEGPEVIEVVIPEAPIRRVKDKGPAPLCTTCGKELEDRRRTKCVTCRQDDKSTTTLKQPKQPKPMPKVTGVTADVTRGMNSITGKVLYMFTLFLAWQAIRRAGIFDPKGDLADEMAMTDEEADIIGRPLTRMFLSSKPGRAIAPRIVEHEDMIDAIFAGWDWYKRMTSMLEMHATNNQPNSQPPASSPAPRRERSNGKTRETTADSSESVRGGDEFGPGYIPPSVFDLAAT